MPWFIGWLRRSEGANLGGAGHSKLVWYGGADCVGVLGSTPIKEYEMDVAAVVGVDVDWEET